MLTDLERDVMALLDPTVLKDVEPDRIESMRDLVIHGEAGVAVEILCANVGDLDPPLESRHLRWLAALQEIVERIPLDKHYATLVRDATARSRAVAR
jgi:hypothetical protein